MRMVMMLLTAAFMIPSAFSLGVVVPSEVSSGTFDMDVGDERTIDFVMRASNEQTNAEFFVEGTEGVYVNGKKEYTKEVSLTEYESEQIEVEFSAIQEGDYVIKWGYVQKGSSSGLQIGQKVQDDFFVRVDASSSSTTVVLLDEGDADSETVTPLVEEIEAAPAPEEEVFVADISTQGSSLTEAVVDTSVANKQVTIAESTGNNNDSQGQEGKGMLLATMSLGVISIGLLGGAIVYVGGDV